jgi:hypothetical protein
MPRSRAAIACQGGGSHTAFTAGVLQGEEHLRNVLHQFFDFEELRVRAALPDAPALQIGAVEVMSGHFEIFSGTGQPVDGAGADVHRHDQPAPSRSAA